MRAVDTNVLVRLLTRDDPRQAAAAAEFIAQGAWVSHLVLAETLWVLSSSLYGFDARRLAELVDVLLSVSELTIQEPDVVARALETFRERPALGFSDCLVVEIARKAGHGPVGTFDRDLGKLDGATLVREGR